MDYDLFTSSLTLAEIILEKCGKCYLVDTIEKPGVYQFFNIKDAQLRRIKSIAGIETTELIDSKNGRLIWPSLAGITFDEAIDLV